MPTPQDNDDITDAEIGALTQRADADMAGEEWEQIDPAPSPRLHLTGEDAKQFERRMEQTTKAAEAAFETLRRGVAMVRAARVLEEG